MQRRQCNIVFLFFALRISSLAVSPLAIATGALGAMVVMGMVAVPLLIGCTWSVVLCFSLSNSKQDTTTH